MCLIFVGEKWNVMSADCGRSDFVFKNQFFIWKHLFRKKIILGSVTLWEAIISLENKKSILFLSNYEQNQFFITFLSRHTSTLLLSSLFFIFCRCCCYYHHHRCYYKRIYNIPKYEKMMKRTEMKTKFNPLAAAAGYETTTPFGLQYSSINQHTWN